MNNPSARTRSVMPVVFISMVLLFTGCAGIRSEYKEKKTFRFEAASQMAQAQRQDTGRTLMVKRFAIAPEFEPLTFIYRVGQNRYSSDYYHNYLVPPTRMITDEVAENCFASIYFAPMPPTSIGKIEYQLWGKIIDLYADIRDQNNAMAVVTLRLMLDKNQDSAFIPVVHKTYTRQIPINQAEAEAYIQAVNQGLTQILDEFFTDFLSLTPDA